MFQVVELYGHFEPWWFLEDWKEDIVQVKSFDVFEDALREFKKQWIHLRVSSPYYKSKSSLLAAFWHEDNQSYCDDCDEPLQEYRSLALLKDWEELAPSYHQTNYEQRNDPPRPVSVCKLKKIG